MADYHLHKTPDSITVKPYYPIDNDYYEVAFTYDEKEHSFFDLMDKTHPASNYEVGEKLIMICGDDCYTSNVVYIAKMKGTTRIFTGNLTPFETKTKRKKGAGLEINIKNPDGVQLTQVVFEKADEQ